MKAFKKIIAGIMLFCIPIQTMAWGTNGHRITGQIADTYLTPKARAAIKKILGNEPVSVAGNWADFVRSDPGYKYTEIWHFVDFDRQMSQPELTEYLEHNNNENAYTKLK